MTHSFQIIAKFSNKKYFAAEETVKPIGVVIPDYREINNHICNMVVTYNDCSEKSLIGRVNYNNLTDIWTVDAMEMAVNVIDVFANENDFAHTHHHSIPELNERIRLVHRSHHFL